MEALMCCFLIFFQLQFWHHFATVRLRPINWECSFLYFFHFPLFHYNDLHSSFQYLWSTWPLMPVTWTGTLLRLYCLHSSISRDYATDLAIKHWNLRAVKNVFQVLIIKNILKWRSLFMISYKILGKGLIHFSLALFFIDYLKGCCWGKYICEKLLWKWPLWY